MNARNGATIARYYKKFGKVPPLFMLSFAAYLLFMKAVKKENEQYFGQRSDGFYPINDDKAAYFYEKWQSVTTDNVAAFVKDVLSDRNLWDNDITQYTGAVETITEHLIAMMNNGVKATMQ